MRLDVLLVDDSSVHRMLVKRSLDDGLDVHFSEASLVREAIEALRSGSGFDCALVDYRLPDGDAFEILREIADVHHGVPVIVLTAMKDERLGRRLREAGAQEYLDKSSLSGGGLAESVRTTVERYRAQATAP